MTAYPSPQDDPERDAAYRRIKARRELASHAVAYVVVNAFLVGVWWVTSRGGYFWPVWVLGGWGVGLAFNAWDVLGRRPITAEDIDREMRRGRSSPTAVRVREGTYVLADPGRPGQGGNDRHRPVSGFAPR